MDAQASVELPFLELFKTKKFYVVTTQILTGTAFGLTALSPDDAEFLRPRDTVPGGSGLVLARPTT